MAEIRAQMTAGTAAVGWSEVDGLLVFHGKVFLPNASALWQETLAAAHDGGHEGVQKSLHRWRSTFYSRSARRRV